MKLILMSINGDDYMGSTIWEFRSLPKDSLQNYFFLFAITVPLFYVPRGISSEHLYIVYSLNLPLLKSDFNNVNQNQINPSFPILGNDEALKYIITINLL